MSITVQSSPRSDELATRLASATAPSAAVFADVVAAGARLPMPVKRDLGRLIEARAFTEAALALVAAEMPAWHVRRLVYDAGEWVCSLSRHPRLPEFLDDAVDATHEELPLAILLALAHARHRVAEMPAGSGRRVPSVRPPGLEPVACENFG